MPYQLIAIDQPGAPPLAISMRLRSQIVYFMTPPNAPQVPPLQAQEYWIDAADTAQWLDDGVFELVSPLDGEQRTTIEWLHTHQIQHIRLEESREL